MTEICIKPIDDNKARIVDCRTSKEVNICELLANMCGGRVASKRKGRAPSAYNVFMGSCVKGKSGPIRERFKSCVAGWKAKGR